MRISTIFKKSNQNLFRSKMRSLLSIIAIVVGSFTLTLTTAIATGANNFIQNQFAILNMNNAIAVTANTSSSTFSLSPQKYSAKKITGVFGINYISPSQFEYIKSLKGLKMFILFSLLKSTILRLMETNMMYQ